jgi:cystathionine beta-lyase family protein involved in aluminum resistance
MHAAPVYFTAMRPQVCAQVMGAEAALMRVQFVSGTHAISSALFSVLRPGDEMLAVAGQ